MEYEEIKKLMDDMGNSKLSSLDIEFPDGIKISMAKTVQNDISVVTAERITPTVVEIDSTKKEEPKDENLQIITSPMVGTFYSSDAPDKPAYIKVGDKIHKGQVVCIVEAMKLMNEIESEFDGEVVEVCAKNEEMVEYGAPLFKIKA
jgi:acetyl-CoA carboxylase biotin carboxyl carrier protein